MKTTFKPHPNQTRVAREVRRTTRTPKPVFVMSEVSTADETASELPLSSNCTRAQAMPCLGVTSALAVVLDPHIEAQT